VVDDGFVEMASALALDGYDEELKLAERVMLKVVGSLLQRRRMTALEDDGEAFLALLGQLLPALRGWSFIGYLYQFHWEFRGLLRLEEKRRVEVSGKSRFPHGETRLARQRRV
jgi:hypothetical protein